MDKAPLLKSQEEERERILKSCEEIEGSESWLEEHLPNTELPDAAHIRLSKLLNKTNPPPLEQSTIHQLTHRWAEPIQELELSNAQIKEPIDLAQDIGLYFAGEKPEANAELANRLAALPPPLYRESFLSASSAMLPLLWNPLF